jgi:hypothetical protein
MTFINLYHWSWARYTVHVEPVIDGQVLDVWKYMQFWCIQSSFPWAFLVWECEMSVRYEKSKGTLRLEKIDRSPSGCKNAYAVIFNTGHWFTHDETSPRPSPMLRWSWRDFIYWLDHVVACTACYLFLNIKTEELTQYICQHLTFDSLDCHA